MSYPSDLVQKFNALPKPKTLSYPDTGEVPNHWHISIRHISLKTSGHLVCLFQPDSGEGIVLFRDPIESYHPQGFPATNIESDQASLTVAILLMQDFVKRDSNKGKPWKWTANDGAWAQKIIESMRTQGVDEDMLNMPVSSDSDNLLSDKVWERFMKQTANSNGALVSVTIDRTAVWFGNLTHAVEPVQSLKYHAKP